MASGTATYVSQCWLPVTGKARFQVLVGLYLSGLLTRKAPLKGFLLTSCLQSSFPKLLDTIVLSPFRDPKEPRIHS